MAKTNYKNIMSDLPSQETVEIIKKNPTKSVVMEDSTLNESNNFEKVKEKMIDISDKNLKPLESEVKVDYSNFKRSVKESPFVVFTVPVSRKYLYFGSNKNTGKEYLQFTFANVGGVKKHSVRLYESHVSRYSDIDFHQAADAITNNIETNAMITFSIPKTFKFFVLHYPYDKDKDIPEEVTAEQMCNAWAFYRRSK